ncbi:MAG: peroxiredoxin family protein [Acidobacteriota bacterium]
MLQIEDSAPDFSLQSLDGETWTLLAGEQWVLLVFFETDCPTCRLMLPYLARLASRVESPCLQVIGISQDNEAATRRLATQLELSFPVLLDQDLEVSRRYDPSHVPALFLVRGGKIVQAEIGFDKPSLNHLAASLTGVSQPPLAETFDGAPQSKPGCGSRHREGQVAGEPPPAPDLYPSRGRPATRIELSDDKDPYQYCREAGFSDPLPVIPPTLERVERMLKTTSQAAHEIVARVPPCYGVATVEKIAANAVMAGCVPEMMRVLVPLVKAACDERFNLHGVQGTTHFAAPLIIVNGPVRRELGFACASNVFSNVTRANTSLGRALQLILRNLGGARPGEIDMSTLGNPGKFSYCIAENEEESPWEPFHVEQGFAADESALTLFAAEPPRGVSEHFARRAEPLLKALSRTLATVWTYRLCIGQEALVVLSPEHVRTLHGDGFSKQRVREFLFDNTGIPVREYREKGGEGTQYVQFYSRVEIDGEPCYRKFAVPELIRILVAGGTSGKFSAVLGSWVTGPLGSQMVSYPIDQKGERR